MSKSRTAFASLAALTAAFSLSACNDSNASLPAPDVSTMDGITVTARNCALSEDHCITEFTSGNQPGVVLVTSATGGLATIDQSGAQPGPFRYLRAMPFGMGADLKYQEFQPAADVNTVCTAVTSVTSSYGHRASSITCRKVTR